MPWSPNWFAKVTIQLRSSSCERPAEAEGMASLCPQARQLQSLPCLLFLPSRQSQYSLLSFRGRPRFLFPCLGSPFL